MAKYRTTGFRNKSVAPEEWNTWSKDPSDENFETVLTTVDPVITSALRSFGGDDPKLRTRARILAAQSIKSYDPSKGAALKTHVYHNLQRLHRFRAERSSAIHIPENTRLDGSAIKKYTAEYEATHGVEPSDKQISDAIEMSMARIKRTRNMIEGSGSQFLSEKGDLPGQARNAEQIWADYVYHDLGEKDRKIYEWTTGYNGKARLAKKDIAAKLSISQAAVSQRVGRIVNKLQEIRA
jgi:DNA-directed RNA polymerase specialized sigma subunit